jgi:GTPase SAR1 family protein
MRNNCYSQEMLSIKRLSGDSLSMDRCYINLTLVEQWGENIDISSGKDGKSLLQSSPFSLDARLMIETPHEDLLVTLPKLFDRRKNPSGNLQQPKRILIRGRAGVGKTTLCRKIVHDVVHGDMWKDMFQRVIWVQLRDLIPLSKENYTLDGMFQHILFQECTSGDLLYKRLAQHIGQAGSGETLFLLDGLDEVSDIAMRREQSVQHPGHAFLKGLLNKTFVIITTRPHTALPSECKKPDLELDTVGFSPDEVEKYLERVISDPEDVVAIHSYLQKNPLMQSLVRIPIQLDALCYIWKTTSSDVILETMTTVYTEITRQLLRKDIERLEIVPDSGLENILPYEIERRSSPISEALENLAFSGLCNNIIEFQTSHLNSILEIIESNMLLAKTFGKISFIRPSNSATETSKQCYHFIHLTFQEYFAAKYYVRKWKDNKPLQCMEIGHRKTVFIPITCQAFLQKHKYDARYDIMWRFVAGLLDGHGEDDIMGFFKKIKSDPIDLLGPTHQRLIMHCLDEAVYLPSGPFRADMEHQLSQWLLFECGFRWSASLASESEFPDNALHSALEDCTKDDKVTILHALQRTGRYLSLRTIGYLGTLLQHEENFVRSTAAQALGRQSNLPESAIVDLIALLQDKESYVRSAAAEALGRQSNLPESAIADLIALLRDEESHLRSAAARAIGRQSNLPESAIAALIALLQHKESGVRSAAAEAIGRQSNLPESAIAALIALLQHKESDIRSDAAEAIGGQSNVLDQLLETSGVLLISESSTSTTESVSCHSSFIECLYRPLLWRSFREQSSLYVDGNHYSVNQQSGLRRIARVHDDTSQCEAAQKSVNPSEFDLWGAIENTEEL